jgi:acyl-CoA thioester hydrolase
MDAFGHVNNVTYLVYLEEARVSLFDQAELGAMLGTGVVVARNEIDYKRPLVYRSEPILVDIWVAEIRRRSWTLQYVIRDEAGAVYARASTVLVAWDLATLESRSLTDEETARLETMRDDA